MKLGNVKKRSNSSLDRGLVPIISSRNKFFVQAVKNYAEVSVQFCLNSSLCSKCFAHGYRALFFKKWGIALGSKYSLGTKSFSVSSSVRFNFCNKESLLGGSFVTCIFLKWECLYMRFSLYIWTVIIGIYLKFIRDVDLYLVAKL